MNNTTWVQNYIEDETGKQKAPSLDQWLAEAKSDPSSLQCGMYLCHNGVVRATPKAAVREGKELDRIVQKLDFSYDSEKVLNAIERTKMLPGIFYVRVWLNEGILDVGNDIMMVLIGGDIRPRVAAALESLVGDLKSNCVTEKEIQKQRANDPASYSSEAG
jgi:molybdopterin synthase catalytic subunit